MKIKKNITNNVMFCCIALVISMLLGIILKDNLMLGSITLFLGCCQVFFMTRGIWWEELFGLAENLVTTIICLKSNLYGTVIFTLIIFMPISIFTLINWKKNQLGGVVVVNKMTARSSFILLFSLVVTISIVSFAISFLPGQNLPVLDSICNLLDLSAVVLLAMRYKEGWLMWVLSSVSTLVMWVIMHINGHSYNSIMMIVLSAIYVCMYLWGFVSFIKMRKKQEKLSTAY